MASTKWNTVTGVTTAQILSLAYCAIFGITTDRGSGIGHYYGQYANGVSCIDYAYFDSDSRPFSEDSDFFEATVEDGSEGCWIRVDLVRYIPEAPGVQAHYERIRVGTIKTLDEGRDAWRNMGALAGELAYMANYDSAWRKVIKRAKELAAQAKNTTTPDHSGNA